MFLFGGDAIIYSWRLNVCITESSGLGKSGDFLWAVAGVRGGVSELLKYISGEGTVSRSFVRNSDESRRHRNLIEKLASAYIRSGFDIKADHISSFDTPPKFSMVMPDIFAEKDGKKIIIEVETRNSIGTDRDRRQRRVFGEWAKKDKDRDFRREITL
ncbi:hypothetical protein ACK3SF_02955 [Candidatus Nanosalina sp. VS9-1]|uniref:hypothetical protein n=1 Tax=Candidatus Nanosalina sp. VS9-1 TaxID=3388566 RepID=UPI0039E0C24D